MVIYYNDRIAYEETLAEALDSMFGEGTSALLNGSTGAAGAAGTEEGAADGAADGSAGTQSLEELAALANEAFANAVAAQQAGDWAAYGAYLDELAAYLNQMAPQEEAAAVLPEDGALEEPAAEGSALEEPAQEEPALETPAAQ